MARFAQFLRRWRALPYIYERLDVLAERLRAGSDQMDRLERRAEFIQEALGRIELRQLATEQSKALADHEFRVFSQWGEDGIIQFLLRQINIEKKVFVEFGVEDYLEANTRFLLVNNNWTGLVIDSNRDNIERLRKSLVCWGYDLRVVHSFITRNNVNQILEENGITGEIGLLSIDIDGNDYWVWRAVEVINPVIVIAEYNHRFGSNDALTIPYDENFERAKNYPLLYFGASLKALCMLAERKGYAFVGCNSNGVNAFFVRRDKLPAGIKEMSVAEGYVAGKFHEMRDEGGRFIQASPEEETQLAMSFPLVNVEETETLSP